MINLRLIMINLRRQLPHYFCLLPFNKTIRIFLLLWPPTLWALWISRHAHPFFKASKCFYCGCRTYTRVAGYVINNFVDCNIDQHIRRT